MILHVVDLLWVIAYSMEAVMAKKMLFLLLMVSVCVSLAFAKDYDARGGQKIFKKSCRLSCHDGTTDAEDLNPLSKTMDQWKSLFANNREELKAAHVNGEMGKLNFTDTQWNDMYMFLFDRALDSDQPESCG